MRLSRLILPIFANGLLFTNTAPAEAKTLTIQSRYAAPMVEISGLSISENQVSLISDREHDLLQIPLAGETLRDLDMGAQAKVEIEMNIPTSQQAQWEAVAVSAREGVFLVKETGSEIYHFNSGGRLVKKYALKTWVGRKNPDRGFEGVFLMQNGHFLIALEADPSALIEYGPEGDEAVGIEKDALVKASDFQPPAADRLVPLASWTIEKSVGACEYSDLAEAPEGGLLILMKSCMKVARVAELKPSKSTFAVADIWNVPSEVFHPEGLQVLPNGDILIATDIKEKGTNIYRLSR